LDDFDTLSATSNKKGMKKLRFNLDGSNIAGHGKKNASKSLRYGVKRGSEGMLTIGRSLRTGVTRAVFPEDLKVSEKMIFDPQDKSLLLWNRLLIISCILSVSVDPLFFYLPVFNYRMACLGMDTNLAATITTMRTLLDVFYLIRMALQFRIAYVAPSSRVFGRGELVIDPAQIATRYLSRYFIVDFLSVLPLPQV
jgi:cyclic nucleotide gated channel